MIPRILFVLLFELFFARVLAQPQIFQVTPSSFCANDTLEIIGQNLDPGGNRITQVEVAGISCPVVSVTNTQVKAIAPTLAQQGPQTLRVLIRDTLLNVIVSQVLTGISAVEDVSVSYLPGPYCQHPLVEISPTILGGQARFSTLGNSANQVDSLLGSLSLDNVGNTIIQWANAACPAQGGTIVLSVTPPTSTSALSYPGSTYCQNDPLPVFPTAPTNIQGNFVGSPGLVVDFLTGEINLAASDSGLHVVTYVPFYGTCGDVSTFAIEILPTDDASINYGDNVFCKFEPNPLPTVVPGGAFNVPPGSDAVVNFSTGELDLQQSFNNAGSSPQFLIRYTTNQGCPNTDSVMVDIRDFSPDFNVPGIICQSSDDTIAATNLGGPGTFQLGSGLAAAGNLTVGANQSTWPIINVRNSASGNWGITFSLDSAQTGCAGSAAETVTLVPGVGSSFLYPDTLICTGEAPVFPNPAPNGELLYSPVPGLDLVPGTGRINPGNSAPGLYPLFALPQGNLCPDTVPLNQVMQVEPTTQASVALIKSIFCSYEPDQSALLALPPGGSYQGTVGLAVNASSGTIDFDASLPNVPHEYIYDPPGNRCVLNDTAGLEIIALNAVFDYPQDTACALDPPFLPAFSVVSPGVAISFSVTPPGLLINPMTGEVDPGGSLPGTYSVTANLTRLSCSETFMASNSIVVIPLPNPQFSLPVQVCRNGAPPVAIPVAPGGTFEVVSGGCIIDSVSGVVDLDSSAAGLCTVRHNLGAPRCPVFSDEVIELLPISGSAFTYPSDTFCAAGGIAMPSPLDSTFTSGGVFAAVSGVGLDLNAANGQIHVPGSIPGDYIVEYTAPSPCASAAKDTVTILPVSSFTFAYREPAYCRGSGQAEVDTATLAITGAFSGALGLVIDSLTGAVDLLASDSGTFPVTFVTTLAAACPQVRTADIRIVAYDSLTTFAYPDDTFCVGDGSVTASIAGNTNGSFSAGPGLFWADVQTGTVDLNLTAQGEYVVNYTLPTVCGEVVTDSLRLLRREDPSFFYLQQDYCRNAAHPSPLSVMTPGGSFSGSLGLVVDPLRGEINLAASIPGVARVYYETPGRCAGRDSLDILLYPPTRPLSWNVFPDSQVCAGTNVEFSTQFSAYIRFFKEGQLLEDRRDAVVVDSFTTGEVVRLIHSDDDICWDTVAVTLTKFETPRLALERDSLVVDGSGEIALPLAASTENASVDWRVSPHPALQLSPESGTVTVPFGPASELFFADVMADPVRYPILTELILELRNLNCPGDRDTLPLIINPPGTPIFIPEVFTPNDDGFNDTWQIRWIDGIDPGQYRIQVFNRTYGEVLNMQPLRSDWRAESLADGVYRWILRGATEEILEFGGVTIRRK
ncbi:MAG: gliding motility-associated C-terminal domain-containing protein [Bacteroidota bacterium]